MRGCVWPSSFCTTYSDTPSFTRKLANEWRRSCNRSWVSPALRLIRVQGKWREGQGRLVRGDGNINGLPETRSIDLRRSMAAAFSVINLGRPVFEIGTRRVLR